MSLKAKLEAVIYAAEEPVTLAQLSALFAADALEWKSAQDAAANDAPVAPEGETLPLLNAELDDNELEEPSEAPVGAGKDSSLETSLEAGQEPVAEDGAERASEAAVEAAAETTAEAPVDAEAEAKRLARQRDREARTVLRGLLDELIASYASDDRALRSRRLPADIAWPPSRSATTPRACL
jgi:segregation and condensation protein B